MCCQTESSAHGGPRVSGSERSGYRRFRGAIYGGEGWVKACSKGYFGDSGFLVSSMANGHFILFDPFERAVGLTKTP